MNTNPPHQPSTDPTPAEAEVLIEALFASQDHWSPGFWDSVVKDVIAAGWVPASRVADARAEGLRGGAQNTAERAPTTDTLARTDVERVAVALRDAGFPPTFAQVAAIVPLLEATSDAARAEGAAEQRGLQRRLYDGEKRAGWDPADANSLAEEIAHLHEEISEAFRAYRQTKGCALTIDEKGKPQGVPAELADAAIGMFYIAEGFGFDLLDAIEAKHRYNLTRSYAAEGRRLHEALAPLPA